MAGLVWGGGGFGYYSISVGNGVDGDGTKGLNSSFEAVTVL
jgi:hypothetical protein